MRLVSIPTIQARHFNAVERTRIDLIVLHSMESQEKPGTARRVAEWFTRECARLDCDLCPGPAPPNPGPYASAHYCVDSAEVIRCVRDEDVAWHAPKANANGIGIEHAGRASQTAVDWADAYSSSVLEISARLAALLCCRWGIPSVVVGEAGLIRGERGITTHAAVSRAFHRSTHTDPGPGFPLQAYVDKVARLRREIEA